MISPAIHKRQFPSLRSLAACLAFGLCALPVQANEYDWSLGFYAGKYHDTEPAGAIFGRTNYMDHYMVALNGSKTLYRFDNWPIDIELDAMIGQQSGKASLTEVAIAPAIRFNGFPWRNTLRTDLRLAPLGVSYTSEVSPLERGPDGGGSRTLNYLFVEAAFSRPSSDEHEFFIRFHHRCTIYDVLNNYGANGEDFATIGYRRKF
jgi:hypothetical protein